MSVDFPTKIYRLCIDEINRQAAEASKRMDYKKVCGRIKKLSDFGGVSEAENIIIELKMKYPRRPAMLEELDLLAMKLAKKKK